MRSPSVSVSSLQIQNRDLDFLRGLYESRLMTLRHAAAIHFGGRYEMAKKRVSKLKAAGLVGERPRLVNESATLFLTPAGANLLGSQGMLSAYPPIAPQALLRRFRVSPQTVRHELEVMDVKAAFHAVLRERFGAYIDTFTTWPALSEFVIPRRGKPAVVKPDGFLRIREDNGGQSSNHAFFLEVDRSTETHDTLLSRIRLYIDHYKSGGFAKQNGAPRDAYRSFPFRVLIVLKTAERRNNLIERLLSALPQALAQIWFSTLAEVMANPLGPIWIRPMDYREAMKGTPFDSAQRRAQQGYQRQTAREVFIERGLKKQSLLG